MSISACLDLAAPGTPVAWTGAGPSPTWLDLAREYTERWVHQQQIRDAVGRPGLKEPTWLRPVLDTFILALPRAYAATPAPVGTRVVVTLAGEAGRSWLLVRGQSRWPVRTADDARADAGVTLPDEVAWRLITRLISRDAARAALRATGERSLTDSVVNAAAVMTSAE